MVRDLSSPSLTRLYRWVMAPMGGVIGACAIIGMAVEPKLITPLVIAVIVCVAICIRCISLYDVSIDTDKFELYISRYRHREVIPAHKLCEIIEHDLSRVRYITLVFDARTPFGQKVSFVPDDYHDAATLLRKLCQTKVSSTSNPGRGGS